MILFWGRADEAPLLAVRKAVARLGHEQFFFDEDHADLAALQATAQGFGTVVQGGLALDLDRVSAAYLRPYGTARLASRLVPAQRAEALARSELLAAHLHAWADVAPGMILSRPSLMASNDSKPVQLSALARLGFRTPATLVTTCPEQARAFAARHGPVIYKSISSIRSIVTRLEAHDHARLAHLAACPTQFQECIAGMDVRVHVVGEDLFACEIASDAVDFRYAALQGLDARLRAIDLPAEIDARCRAAARAFGLPLCGIDLRRTSEGEWYAFEVNPSPGYSYFADAVGHPIAESIARLLTGAASDWTEAA